MKELGLEQLVLEEFELETRFQNLSTKLDFIADNLKFFADQMENKKSHRLEIYIIILIAAELGVSLYEHPELYEFLFFCGNRLWPNFNFDECNDRLVRLTKTR